ncbi:TPA: hypothetical protein ACH3X2_007411 [Trebouxia sp. C0005]
MQAHEAKSRRTCAVCKTPLQVTTWKREMLSVRSRLANLPISKKDLDYLQDSKTTIRRAVKELAQATSGLEVQRQSYLRYGMAYGSGLHQAFVVHTVVPSASKALSGCLSEPVSPPVHHRLLTHSRSSERFSYSGLARPASNWVQAPLGQVSELWQARSESSMLTGPQGNQLSSIAYTAISPLTLHSTSHGPSGSAEF